jgi:NADPH:quinone reductase-like Zn-dependent oxidoreductase
MNPAMSSWVALRRRVPFQAGQNVLVLGATGNAGRLAVQIAKLFGANQIIAAGIEADRLATVPQLGATSTVLLEAGSETAARRLGQAASEVDVVIDYLWGGPATAAMAALATSRADPARPFTWINIGSAAGPAASVPAAALRAARLQIVGSGIGSVSAREILAELPAIAQQITSGTIDVDARPVPLSDIEQAWADASGTRQRIVIRP